MAKNREQIIDSLVDHIWQTSVHLDMNEGEVLKIGLRLIGGVIDSSPKRKEVILALEKIVFEWRQEYG